MTIIYEVKFYDYWHLSSGLSGGTTLDSYVIKDDRGLPYMPGKTIKGLVREMAEKFFSDEAKLACFGKKSEKDDDMDNTTMGECYFSSATLADEVAEDIVGSGLTHTLYDVISATSMDESGIAKDGSLRDIEVVLPLSLNGEITNVPDTLVDDMKRSLKMIKRAGLNRNRGLGRCEFIVRGVK
ncbi:CRISPR-associated protein [Campylobacter sp. RM13119]|uniref:RAMP superfamily CRISPR-associated protein n=1 Tax=Campylobacter californiensis TaxID=1032243 RepID=UPI001474982E|nr:RAMP superfamily CRISPR-associated protein [Campylobacter sp. RM13119]MBE3606714.1 CRISPR-associated protein [Campylobacter sp. RM13119]